MSVPSKECPSCRPKLKDRNCEECGGTGTLPLCPPIGEVVLYRSDVGLHPLTVIASRRVVAWDAQAPHVEVDGWYQPLVHVVRTQDAPQCNCLWIEAVQGPRDAPGCWQWKGEPS